MVWFKVDDGFHSHPKVLATSLAARGLWVSAGSWSSDHLTDGFVPGHVLTALGSTPELVTELVTAGLWRRRKTGIQFHDFLSRNPSREAVENERKQAAERQRRRREGILSRRDTGVTHGVSSGAPTRPDPYVSTGSYQRAGPRYPQPDLPPSNGSAATRQPPPFEQAVKAALNPEPWDAFTKENP